MILRATLRPLVLLGLALAAPAAAADFRIGAVAFAPADFLDARALPMPGGAPVIMLTFTDAALPKLTQATTSEADEVDVPVMLDGKLLTRLVVRGARSEPVLTIGGATTLPEAERIAKAISGKDPLPETLGD